MPATLTIKDGKGTITLGHDEDGDAGDAPEEELTDEEKRIHSANADANVAAGKAEGKAE